MTAAKFMKFLILLAIIVIILTGLATMGGLSVMAYSKDSDPEGYTKAMRKALGRGLTYSFSEEDQAKILEKELDPEKLALVLAATNWIKTEFDGNIGPGGILFSVDQHEWKGGLNPGHSDGMKAATSNDALKPDKEKAAVLNLLAHWEKHKIRDWSEPAAEQVWPNYDGYWGAQWAGEMGPGIIPTTGWMVCQALMKSEDPEVASCNFWDPKVAMFASAYYIYLIGYDGDSDFETRTYEMMGWNTLHWYCEVLVRTADMYNLKLEKLGLVELKNSQFFGKNNGWSGLKQEVLIPVFLLLDLMPPETPDMESVLAELPEGMLVDGAFIVNLNKDIPWTQSANVALHAKMVPQVVIPSKTKWGFCENQNEAGWYGFTINAYGICANASIYAAWAEIHPDLRVVYSKPHKVYKRWPVFTKVVYCWGGETAQNPATYDVVIENTGDEEVIGLWSQTVNEKGQKILIFQTLEPEPEAPVSEIEEAQDE